MPVVRPGTGADRSRLAAIQTDALAEPWPGLLEIAVGDGPVLYVVEPEDDGPVVGYAVALTADAPLAYVPEVAVDPAWQGRGFGSALLDGLFDALRERGIDRVRLTVRAGDERARAFYADHGFTVVDRVTDHFEAGDGLVVERTL